MNEFVIQLSYDDINWLKPWVFFFGGVIVAGLLALFGVMLFDGPVALGDFAVGSAVVGLLGLVVTAIMGFTMSGASWTDLKSDAAMQGVAVLDSTDYGLIAMKDGKTFLCNWGDYPMDGTPVEVSCK